MSTSKPSAAPLPRIPVSAVVVAKDEADNLPRCLPSLRFFDEVVMIDDGSSDESIAIARGLGVRVLQEKLTTFADLQNWAHEHAGLRHDWVLWAYADEEFTEELATAIGRAITDPEAAGYLLCGKVILFNRWVRFSSSFPAWMPKLIHRGRARFDESGHTYKFADARGPIKKIHEPFFHYNFSKGFVDWWARHNRYSSDEARETLKELDARLDWGGIVSPDSYRRRQALRAVARRLPLGFRPPLKFLYLFVFKFGFLDGWPGFTFAMLQAIFEYMIGLKVREELFKRKGNRM